LWDSRTPPPEGNRRAYIRGPKGHSAATQHQRYDVASYEGGGRHGHLGIIMTSEEYFAIAVDVFPVPANPGPLAAVVAGMTAVLITETTRLHRKAIQVYGTYHNVDQVIKKLIIESFDDTYLNALSDEILGYANCTSLQLLTHLL
jgi:hypothetical protein